MDEYPGQLKRCLDLVEQRLNDTSEKKEIDWKGAINLTVEFMETVIQKMSANKSLYKAKIGDDRFYDVFMLKEIVKIVYKLNHVVYFSNSVEISQSK